MENIDGVDYKKLLSKVINGALNEEGYGFTISMLSSCRVKYTDEEFIEFEKLVDAEYDKLIKLLRVAYDKSSYTRL